MKPVVRRRLAVAVTATAAAVVAGLLVAPAASAADTITVSPSFAFNNETKTITITPTASGNPGYPPNSTVTFTRHGTTDSFTGTTDPSNPAAPTVTVTFSDVGNGVGSDGPANAGLYDVTIAAPGPAGAGYSDSCSSCFTVLNPSTISLTGASPSGLPQGGSANVTLSGSGFSRSSIAQVLLPDGSGVDPTIDTSAAPQDSSGKDITSGITTSTTMERRWTVGGTTPTGPRNIRFLNPDGTTATCTGCFTVNGGPLTSVAPTAGSNNPSATNTVVIFNGTGLRTGTPSLVFVGSAGSSTKSALTIVGTNPRFSADGSSVTADYDLRSAAPGTDAYQPTLTQSDASQNTCTCRFSVAQPSPATVTDVSPTSQKAGTTQTVQVTGTNFSKGVRIVVSGTGVTNTAVTFVSPTRVDATLAVASGAAVGARDVSATTTDGVSTGAACKGCYTITAGASPTPSGSASGSPQPQGCPGTPVTVHVNTPTINATGQASVTVTGATPTATIELQGYSQNHAGTANFDNDPTKVDRSGQADSNGSITFNDLRPASNTRVRARQAGCSYGNSAVIEVRAQETLAVSRVGTRKYTFSGRSIPARPGGLIISLYRIVGSPCAAGVEPSSCPGEKFVGQARAAALGAPNQGLYSITITFPSSDSNVRAEFVVKTGRDAQNAPGRSNARSLLIY